MKELQKALRDGAKDYTPAVMWFTSGNIDKREMTYQMEGFRKQNLQDFFIHPSSDTRGDYLGDYHFRMIEHAAKEAERLGLKFWIYDEYNWPSGTAGGQVLEEEPWTHGICLSRTVQTALPGQTVRVSLPPEDPYATTVLLTAADGAILDGTDCQWTNTTDHAAVFEVYYTSRTLRKSDCLVGSEVVKKDTLGYLDTLNPDAVAVFVRKTHASYKARIGSGFGKHVRGIFTDEVATMPQAFGEKRPEYPWTDRFEAEFAKRNGYSIRPRLRDLLERTDAKLTVDYWETVTALFMEAYMDTTQQWCERNGLIYTGHMLAEELMEWTVFLSGDPYEYYKRFTWPGIDSILTYHLLDHYFFNLPGKRVASAARFLGKERVLCETFTCSSWDMRLRDMKRAFNRLALLGVDFIQFMGAKYDFMPGPCSYAMTNNWQNPLFRHYADMSRYISGIQYFISNTEYAAQTLLFYPITTARATLPPLPPGEGRCLDGTLNFTMGGLVNALLNLNVPFEFGFEQVVDEAEIKDGALWIAGSAYKTVILPATVYLKEKTFRQLEKFAESGGKLVAVNGSPLHIIGEDSVYDAPQLKNRILCDCTEYEIQPGPDEKRDGMGAFTHALRQALGEDLGSVVRFTPCEGLMSALRRKDSGYYVLLINDKNEAISVQGQVLTSLPFCLLDTETGNQKPIQTADNRISFRLSPYESAILVLSPESVQDPVSAAPIQRQAIPLVNTAFSIPGLNTARPDMYQVRGTAAEQIIQANQVCNPKRVCDLAKRVSLQDRIRCKDLPNRFIRDKNKVDWYGCYPADEQKILPGETVVCVYDFTLDQIPAVLELVTDPQYHTAWYLNDQQLYQTGTKRVWHYANPVYDLTGIAEPGENRLVSVCSMPNYDRGGFCLPCAAFYGTFRFFDDCVLTQKPGGNLLTYWNGQGYRCYTGDGSYTAEFTAPEAGRTILKLHTADVVEIWVNGVFAAKRLWDPYEADLTPYLIPGINKLELRVTSTLSNFISNPNPSGIRCAELFAEV